jgi:hypothetical protein
MGTKIITEKKVKRSTAAVDLAKTLGPHHDITIAKIPLSRINAAAYNPRRDLKASEPEYQNIERSLDEFGYVDPLVWNETTGNLVGGHQRLKILKSKGIKEITVSVVRLDPIQEKKLNLALNKTSGKWDEETLKTVFEELAEAHGGALEELLSTGFSVTEMEEMLHDPLEIPDLPKVNPRKTPLDLIITWGEGGYCCISVLAGLKYGISSVKSSPCPYATRDTIRKDSPHKIVFVDNEYADYKHDVHLAAVERFKPKYATTRDIMSKDQCAQAKIKHFSFEQIMKWAEELKQHAQNVIIIPKYDCIKDIPKEYVLGFSIPTSHGGTKIDAKLFKGRKIHLLGGSWKAQLGYLGFFGTDVVSMDQNYIGKIAQYGNYVTPDGDTKSLAETLNLGFPLPNPCSVATALSSGAIVSKMNEIMVKEKMKEAEGGI